MGNIDEFIENEKLDLSIGYYNYNGNCVQSELYIISEDENSWQSRFDIVEETVDNYFKGQSSYLELIALTSELYENEVKTSENAQIDIRMAGCWATRNNNKLKLQKFIKVSDGVYITSSDSAIGILEEGDIIFKEVYKICSRRIEYLNR
ncbi:MAG: hypothetical protein IJZ90_04250 [Clostridia bacterium]|nr:hypothetical protein [Clostridia bacterium]